MIAPINQSSDFGGDVQGERGCRHDLLVGNLGVFSMKGFLALLQPIFPFDKTNDLCAF